MTRTNKWQHSERKYFTHNGYPDEHPNHVKKDGFGKGNWGRVGDEINDLISEGKIPTVWHKERRCSNSSSNESNFSKIQNLN